MVLLARYPAIVVLSMALLVCSATYASGWIPPAGLARESTISTRRAPPWRSTALAISRRDLDSLRGGGGRGGEEEEAARAAAEASRSALEKMWLSSASEGEEGEVEEAQVRILVRT